jgi:hypothetical protein
MNLIRYDDISIHNILNLYDFGFDCECNGDSKVISLEVRYE